MDIRREIKDTDSALRDFTAAVLVRNLGENWWNECGLSQKTIEAWRKRKAEVESKVQPMQGEENLLFYAPFEEMILLIIKNWEYEFNQVFDDVQTLEVYLKTLNHYLQPDVGRRELFIFQKHLVLGITGEIRARIIAFRSLNEVGKDGFPRIESVKDSFGNIWTVGKPMRLKTNATLRVGDVVEYIITASDPEQQPLQYRILGFKWETSNILRLKIEDKNIARDGKVNITIRSNRKFHAYPLGYDDRVVFEYQILPG